ncbi:DUF1266 domain-containing protein [Streptomyces sp. NBC_01511]|uniref:DUF1266 domain-containing protein n=1 Tax=Streptomyces sp. NBC_01511 TaxID=2903889 RepID=UPI0038654DDE
MHTATEDEVHDEFFPIVPTPQDGTRWQAPADLEQYLYRLASTGDTLAYLRAVAIEGAYYPARLEEPSAADEGKQAMLTTDVPDGRTVATVFTAGVLPRPHPYLVYEYATLGELAQILPAGVDILAVNPATPCEQHFPVDDEERDAWLDLHHELFSSDELMDRVVTRRTGVLPTGPLLHGLACGAHLCFTNGDAWNTTYWHGMGYQGERERVSESWDVHDREDWLGIEQRLLEREVSPWYWDFVLGARAALIDAQGARVDPEQWRDCVEATLRDQAARTGTSTDDPEFDEFVAHLRSLVGKLLRYESRFRADGLLPPDGVVRSVAAWDIGRGSKMARWGRGARYATEAEMYAALERASGAARAAYGSWEEFSAGYVLGRCLHFDEEEFGPWYTTVLDAHRALTTTPDSPWLTVPFGTG